MITLYNVIDTRTNKFHSVVVCKKNQAKWFIPAPIVEEEE